MLENAMPGEALLPNGVLAENLKQAASQNGHPDKKLQDMAEKLEKSEAGRKKLRQAISMLKEKVEANEKVLEVNDILRQECEKERLRAEAERNRAEEEKNLREEAEKEGLSTKEQLILVLKRLDAVERNSESDRNEIERMRKEMKQAISGLGGAVNAIETAHSAFQGLEKKLLSKVSNAVSACTKSTSLAESAISDAKRAQGTAIAAEKLLQSLVSRIAVLQKQGASLDQRVNVLQHEIRMRHQDPLEKGPKLFGNGVTNGIVMVLDKPSGKGMVLSKSQQQTCTTLISPRSTYNVNVYSPENTGPISKGTSADPVSSVSDFIKPADTDFMGTCRTRLGAITAEFADIEALPDSSVKDASLRVDSSALIGDKVTDSSIHGLSVQNKSVRDASTGNIVREALEAAKRKRELSRTSSTNKVIPQSGQSTDCRRTGPGTLTGDAPHARGPSVNQQELLHRAKTDRSNGSMLALIGKEGNECVGVHVSVLHQRARNDFYIPEGFSDVGECLNEKDSRRTNENGDDAKLTIFNQSLPRTAKVSKMLKSGAKIVTNEHKKENLSVALIKDITKLFLKEKKSHAKIEQKLATLQKSMQGSEEDDAARKGLPEVPLDKSRKRKRRECAQDTGDKRACVNGLDESHSISSLGHQIRGKVGTERVVVEARKCQRNRVVSEEETAGVSLPPSAHYSDSRPGECGTDVCEAGWKTCRKLKDLFSSQSPDVGTGGSSRSTPSLVWDGSTGAAAVIVAPCKEIEIDPGNISAIPLNGEWESDLDASDDELGGDWWTAKRELLSPGLPEVPPPLLEETDFRSPLPWPAAGDMNLEDISLFLDVLPPIDQETADEVRTAGSLTDIVVSRVETEEMPIQSGETVLQGEGRREFLPRLDTQTLNHLQKCRETSISGKFPQSPECGSKPSGGAGVYEKYEQKNTGMSGSLIGGSLSSESQSVYLPPLHEEVNIVPSKKSVGLNNTLGGDPVASGDVLRGSQVSVKEEKIDVVQHAAVELVGKPSPYVVELVCQGSPCATEANSSLSINQQGSAISPSDISGEIMGLFRRTRECICGTLSHNNCDTVGSRDAVVKELASFVSSMLSKADLMCIFIASVVDLHALWDNETAVSCFIAESKLIQLLVDVVKQVLSTEVIKNIWELDHAFSYFALQLQNFLMQGIIQPVNQLIPEKVPAEGNAVQHFFHFTTSSLQLSKLRALTSASKLLAVFCEATGMLGFLRNSIYLMLRFSDMDSQCLLGSIFMFASMGCKRIFSIDKDDMVGQAVHVVIAELIRDVEQGECSDPSSPKIVKHQLSGSDFTEWTQNLGPLREVTMKGGDLSFEAFLPGLVESFHEVISALPSQLLDSRHLFQRSLRTINCHQNEPKTPGGTNIPEISQKSSETGSIDGTCSVIDASVFQTGEEVDSKIPEEEYYWRYDRDKSSIGPANLVEEWEQKFYDIASAVELVASHLGWEWTYNDFIVEELWKLVTPGAPAMTVACVVHMFGLLGRLGREVDDTELPGVDELRRTLLVVLSSGQSSASSSEGSIHNFSFRAQVAAAQALLVLFSFNKKDEVIYIKDWERQSPKSSELHSKSVKSLWNWVKTSKSEIEKILPASLRYALLSIDQTNFVPVF